MKKTMNDYLTYCEEHGLKARLVRAVIRQHGRGWEGWQETAPKMARYGADGGFDGFIWYSEAAEFTRRNRALIADYVDAIAEDLGECPLRFVQGFSYIGPAFSEAENARCLYGRGENVQILHALACFVAKACAHAFEHWVCEAQ